MHGQIISFVDEARPLADLRPDERMKRRDESDRQLRGIIKSLGDRLDAKTTNLVLDFVDHNEMGVALEWIYDYLGLVRGRSVGHLSRGRQSRRSSHSSDDRHRPCPRASKGPNGRTPQAAS